MSIRAIIVGGEAKRLGRGEIIILAMLESRAVHCEAGSAFEPEDILDNGLPARKGSAGQAFCEETFVLEIAGSGDLAESG